MTRLYPSRSFLIAPLPRPIFVRNRPPGISISFFHSPSFSLPNRVPPHIPISPETDRAPFSGQSRSGRTGILISDFYLRSPFPAAVARRCRVCLSIYTARNLVSLTSYHSSCEYVLTYTLLLTKVIQSRPTCGTTCPVPPSPFQRYLLLSSLFL